MLHNAPHARSDTANVRVVSSVPRARSCTCGEGPPASAVSSVNAFDAQPTRVTVAARTPPMHVRVPHRPCANRCASFFREMHHHEVRNERQQFAANVVRAHSAPPFKRTSAYGSPCQQRRNKLSLIIDIFSLTLIFNIDIDYFHFFHYFRYYYYFRLLIITFIDFH
jgi:hypothetical protein